MNRRESVRAMLSLGVAAWPLGALAQSGKDGKVWRIGIATDFDSPEMRRRFIGFLRELGWVEGRNCRVVDTGLAYGSPAGQVARSVVALKPDVIVVVSTAYTLAVHRLDQTTPIVMWASGYPVEAGLADSLARPGRNVTGNSLYAGARVWGKLVELLNDARPGAKRIGVLWGYVPPLHPIEEVEPCYRELRDAGRALRLAVEIKEVGTSGQVPSALEALGAKRIDALVVTSGPGLWSTRPMILQHAVDRRLPTIADFAQPPDNVAARPLLTYSPSWDQLLRKTASYVARILHGSRPAEMPIELPEKFELEVNLKAARAIGLELPRSILLRADRVIE